MKTISRMFLIVALAVGLTTGLSGNGLNLNGSGAKSDAMGGAFVGLANDFSAAFWNPGGLAQLTKASFSLYGADILPQGSYVLSPYGIDAKSVAKSYIIPGLGYFQPLGKRVVVGIYLYAPSGAGSTWRGEDLILLSGGKTVYKWYSMLGIFTASPSIAVKITDQIMLGATVDVNYGMLKMDQPILFGPGVYTQYTERLKGLAVGGTVGLLVKPVKEFSLGVTYRLPFTAKLKGDVTIPAAAALPGTPPTTVTGTRSAAWPSWLAGGVAIKPTDRLTITADVQYTNWKKMQTIPVTFDNDTWQTYLSSGAAYELLWKDTTMLRFGAEYLVTDNLALRAGYTSDPNPGPIATQNILLPEFKYNWFTFGFGYNSNSFTVNAAIQYGKGDNIDVPLVGDNTMPGVHGMKMWVPSLDFTYKF